MCAAADAVQPPANAAAPDGRQGDIQPPVDFAQRVRRLPPEERRRQRALNKIKRAVCETTNAESKTVRLNRRTMKAFRIEGRVAVEIASVSHDAKIHWAHDVSPAVRARTDELLRE